MIQILQQNVTKYPPNQKAIFSTDHLHSSCSSKIPAFSLVQGFVDDDVDEVSDARRKE